MRSFHWSPLGLFVLAGFVYGPAAHAEQEPPGYPNCERSPTDSEISAAKGAFEAGQVSFHEADYDRTILYWEDAFRRDCTALPLLLNLARAYELNGKLKHAVVALETYLERRPDAEDRQAIQKRILHLQEQAEALEARARPAEPTQPVVLHEDTSAATDKGTSSAERPLWPVLLGGGGLAVAGVGLAVTLVGQGQVNGYTNGLCSMQSSAGEYQCRAETRRDPMTNQEVVVRDQQTVEADAKRAVDTRNIGIALTSVGGAALLTGVVAWAITWSNGGEEVALLPVLSPGYAGLNYSGKF